MFLLKQIVELARSMWAWLDGFIFGKIVRMECEYCSYALSESQLDAFDDEDALLDAAFKHPCHIKSRLRFTMVSQRFGFWESDYVFSKSLWGR